MSNIIRAVLNSLSPPSMSSPSTPTQGSVDYDKSFALPDAETLAAADEIESRALAGSAAAAAVGSNIDQPSFPLSQTGTEYRDWREPTPQPFPVSQIGGGGRRERTPPQTTPSKLRNAIRPTERGLAALPNLAKTASEHRSQLEPNPTPSSSLLIPPTQTSTTTYAMPLSTMPSFPPHPYYQYAQPYPGYVLQGPGAPPTSNHTPAEMPSTTTPSISVIPSTPSIVRDVFSEHVSENDIGNFKALSSASGNNAAVEAGDANGDGYETHLNNVSDDDELLLSALDDDPDVIAVATNDSPTRNPMTKEQHTAYKSRICEINRLIHTTNEEFPVTRDKIIVELEPALARGLNTWNIYQQFFNCNVHKECRRLDVTPDLSKGYNSQLVNKAYVKFQEAYSDGDKWKRILVSWWRTSGLASLTVAERQRAFLKIEASLRKSIQFASDRYGFQAAVVLTGNIVNQDQGLSSVLCTPHFEGFFKEKLDLEDDDLKGLAATHVYSKAAEEFKRTRTLPEETTEIISNVKSLAPPKAKGRPPGISSRSQTPGISSTLRTPGISSRSPSVRSKSAGIDEKATDAKEDCDRIKAALEKLAQSAQTTFYSQAGKFLWKSMPLTLSKAGYDFINWPESVPLPNSKADTSTRGLSGLPQASRAALLYALERTSGPSLSVQSQKRAQTPDDMYISDDPRGPSTLAPRRQFRTGVKKGKDSDSLKLPSPPKPPAHSKTRSKGKKTSTAQSDSEFTLSDFDNSKESDGCESPSISAQQRRTAMNARDKPLSKAPSTSFTSTAKVQHDPESAEPTSSKRSFAEANQGQPQPAPAPSGQPSMKRVRSDETGGGGAINTAGEASKVAAKSRPTPRPIPRPVPASSTTPSSLPLMPASAPDATVAPVQTSVAQAPPTEAADSVASPALPTHPGHAVHPSFPMHMPPMSDPTLDAGMRLGSPMPPTSTTAIAPPGDGQATYFGGAPGQYALYGPPPPQGYAAQVQMPPNYVSHPHAPQGYPHPQAQAPQGYAMHPPPPQGQVHQGYPAYPPMYYGMPYGFGGQLPYPPPPTLHHPSTPAPTNAGPGSYDDASKPAS